MPDVVVVGGGAMGSAAAWQAARRGRSVVLLEQFAPGHARGSSHGSARIFRHAYPQQDYALLARAALRGWRELEGATGRDLLTLTGALDHGDPAAVAELAATLQAIDEPYEILPAPAAHERWPGLHFTGDVLVHPNGGRVHADHAVAAAQRAAADLDADVRHDTAVVGLRVRGDGRVEAVTAGATVVADVAVVAAGSWSAGLLDGLVDLPPLRVTREQPVHFTAPDAAAWPSFIHHETPGTPDEADGQIAAYGLGSVDGVKLGFHGVGPVVDPDEPGGCDAAALAAVRAYAQRWLPGVVVASAVATGCLYTTTPDHDFVVDRSGPIVVLAGFSGHGFKFVPAIGALAADLAEGRRTAPARFALRPRAGGRMGA